jgi:hypothetical protein
MLPLAMSILARRTCAPVRMPAVAHLAQQPQVFSDRPVAVRTVLAGVGQRPAVRPHLFGRETVHVGQPALHQPFGELIQLLEVIRSVVLVRSPIEAEPVDRLLDGVDVFLLLLRRIGVIESQVADPAVLLRQPEVEADRLGVAEMQVSVWLRRKPRADRRRIGCRAGMKPCGPWPASPSAGRHTCLPRGPHLPLAG